MKLLITIILCVGFVLPINAMAYRESHNNSILFRQWIATDGGGVLNISNGHLDNKFQVNIYYTPKKINCDVDFIFNGSYVKGKYSVYDVNCGMPAEHGTYSLSKNVLDMKDSKTGSEYFIPYGA